MIERVTPLVVSNISVFKDLQFTWAEKLPTKQLSFLKTKVFVADPGFQDFLLAVKLGGNASNQKGEGGRDTGTSLCVVVIVCVCSNGLKHRLSARIISILRTAYELFLGGGKKS